MKWIFIILAFASVSACKQQTEGNAIAGDSASVQQGTAGTTPGITRKPSEDEAPWRGWNKYQIKPEDTLTTYGHELIANTSYYLGPKGKVARMTNGMAGIR